MSPTEFGLFVDKHGDPSRRMGTDEWGTAERAASHPHCILLSIADSLKFATCRPVASFKSSPGTGSDGTAEAPTSPKPFLKALPT